MFDDFDSVDPEISSGRQNLPEGTYTLAVLKVEDRQSKKDARRRNAIVHVVVLDPGDSQAKAGQRGALAIQTAGHIYPDHQTRDLAQLKQVIGAIAGYSDTAAIKAHVTRAVLVAAFGDAQPFRGHVFGARIYHETGKKDGKTYQRIGAASPVLIPGQAEGNPQRVDVRQYEGAQASPPSVSAPMAPPPVVAPPAPPPPSRPFPPVGWTAHPNAPGYYYQGQEVLTEAQLRAKV